MNTALLYTALSMGFLGSLHCAGMCGPIMLIMPFQLLQGWKKALGIGLYHCGRISVYALMGIVLHSFRSLFHPAWQQYVSIGLGVLLLIAGLFSFYAGGRKLPALPWTSFVKAQAGRFIGKPGFSSLFAAGVLNGLLPCGLVYMALSVAAMAPYSTDAVLAMYAFGFGTLPMLISITLVKSRMSLQRLSSFRKAVPVLMLTFGALFVLRGMNLGIPYLSPAVAIEGGTVKSSCCHK